MLLFAISDLPDPDHRGLTYREANLLRQHGIPLGALVEHNDSGIRLFVRHHTRDCDGTPLYVLAADMDDDLYLSEGMYGFRMHPGYSEGSLRTVRLPYREPADAP